MARKLPCRRFDAREDALILELREAKRSIRSIAAAIGRPASSVQVRLDDLQRAAVGQATPIFDKPKEDDMARRKKDAVEVEDQAADMLDAEDEDAAEQAVHVAIETMTGDLRDFMLDRLRYEQDKRPWDKRSEFEQRDTVRRVEEKVRDSVRQAVELIAAQGRRTIKATLDSITIKDGIKGAISLSKHDEQRHALCDAQGASILIVVADVGDYTGERAPPTITPDQGDLETAVVHSEPDGSAQSPFH